MIRGFIGAVIGAVLGMALWAAVAFQFGYEIGFVSLLIGVFCGYGARLLSNGKARGAIMGAICAVLAIVAIFGGKVVATRLIKEHEIVTFAGSNDFHIASQESYDRLLEQIELLEGMGSDPNYREFMVACHFTDAETSSDVTPRDIERFKGEILPRLQAFQDKRPAYERWSDDTRDLFVKRQIERMKPTALVGYVVRNRTLADLLFALFGIVAAIHIASGAKKADDFGGPGASFSDSDENRPSAFERS